MANPKLDQAIIDALENIDPAQGERTSFNVARALRGLCIQFGLKDKPEAVKVVVEGFAEENGLDPETLYEEVFAAWGAIRFPQGVNVLEAALQHARKLPEPALPWPSGLRRVGGLILGIADHLTNHGRHECFLPCRTIAAKTGTSPITVSRVLSMLCEAGYLKRVGRATATRAQSFALVHKKARIQEYKNSRTKEFKN